MADLKEIYNEWQNNPNFRAEFKKDPAKALKDAGFELSPKDFAKIRKALSSDKSKNEKLDDRISK